MSWVLLVFVGMESESEFTGKYLVLEWVSKSN